MDGLTAVLEGILESYKWVSLRGAVMHADKRVACGVDIEPYLVRTDCAAYDVILHERKWERRTPFGCRVSHSSPVFFRRKD